MNLPERALARHGEGGHERSNYGNKFVGTAADRSKLRAAELERER
jgi:hypothetical protein